MPEQVRLPDTSAPFAAWLESLPGEQVVGICADMDDCPLARFLVASGVPPKHVRVLPAEFTEDSSYSYPGAELRPLPEWANAFARAVDKSDERATDEDIPITAAACLRLLEGLPNA